MADFDIPQDAIVCHNIMVDRLSTLLMDDDMARLKNHFRRNPISIAENDRIRDIFTLFAKLMKHEVIRYGQYEQIISVLGTINPAACSVVTTHERRIQDIINNEDASTILSNGVIPDETYRGDTEVEDTFIKTKAYEEAWSTLMKHRCVVLLGKQGEGKTAITNHLVKCLKDTCPNLQVINVAEEKDIARIREIGTGIITLDDLEYHSEAGFLVEFLFEKTLKGNENSYVIIAGSLDWTDTLKVKTSKILNVDVSINLSSESFTLKEHEKEEMLQVMCEIFEREYKIRSSVIITDAKTNMPFPLAIYHFFRNKSFYENGAMFFQTIQTHLNKEVHDLLEEDESSAREAIIIALLCSEKDRPLKTDVSSLKRILRKNKVEISMDLEQDKLDEGVEFLHGKCLKVLGQRRCVAMNVWSYEAMEIYLLRKHFVLATEILNINWILKKVYITNCTGEDGVVNIENTDFQRILARRLLAEVSKVSRKDCETIMTHPLMSNGHFINLIMKTSDLKSMVVAHEATRLNDGDEESLFLCLSTLCSKETLCNALIQLHKDHFPDYLERAFSYAVRFATKGPRPTYKVLEDLVRHGADMNFSSTDIPPPCALQIAAERNDNDIVQLFLRNGAFVPKTKWHFWDFLKCAAEEGDAVICNANLIRALLIKVITEQDKNKYATFARKTVNLLPYSKRDCTRFMLRLAEQFGVNDTLVQAFRKFNINVTWRDEYGSNIFHILLKSRLEPRLLHESMYAVSAATIQSTIINNANNNGECAIHIAVREHGSDTVRLMIENLKSDSTKTYDRGMNLLHLCVTSNKHNDAEACAIATILLKHCKKQNEQNSDGQSAIDLALGLRDKRIKTLCVLQGVDCNPNDDVHPALLLTRLPRSPTTEDIMKTILFRPHRDKTGLTPILYSLQEGFYEWVNYFLENNTNLADHSDAGGNSALHHCLTGKLSEGQKKDLIKRLLNNHNCDINRENEQHETALCRALQHCKLSGVIKHVLTLQPNLYVNDGRGGRTTIIHKLVASCFDDETVLDILQTVFNTNNCEDLATFCNSNGLTCLKLALNKSEPTRDATAKFLLVKTHTFVTDDSLPALLSSCVKSECNDDCIRDMCLHLSDIAEGNNIENVSDHIHITADLALENERYLPKTLALLLTKSDSFRSRDVFQIALEKKKLLSSLVQAISKHRYVQRWKQTDVVRDLVIINDITPRDLRSILTELKSYGVNLHLEDGSSLYYAMKGRTTLKHICVLLDMGSKNHYVDSNGNTLLHICVLSQRSDKCTSSIIEKLNPKKNINIANNSGETAVMVAVQNGKPETLKILLRFGAHVNIRDKKGKSIVHHCVESSQSDLLVCQMLEKILIMYHTNKERDHAGMTPINAAASHATKSRISTILRLAQCGYNVDVKDNSGSTPLHNAIKLHGVTPTISCERVCRVGILLWSKAKRCQSAMEICKTNQHALSREYRLLNTERPHLLKSLTSCFAQMYDELLGEEGNFTTTAVSRKREQFYPDIELQYLIKVISDVLSSRDLDYTSDPNNESDFVNL